MDEREESTTATPEEHIADNISEQVRSVLSAAESAATAIRHEAEQQAAARRRAAEAQSAHIIEDAKREAAELLEARIRRIAELSDRIVEGAEALLMRLDNAGELRRELDATVSALADAAGSLARENQGVASPPAEPSPRAQTAPATERPAVAEPPPAQAPRDESAGAAQPRVDEPVADEPAQPVARPEAAAQPAVERPAEPAEVPAPAEARSTEEIAPAEQGREEPGPPQPVQLAAERAGDSDEVLGARLVALQMAVAGGNRGEVEAHLRRAFELGDTSEILDDVFGRGTDADARVAWPDAS